MKVSSPRWNSGLTLVELLMVVAILTVLGQATFPGFSDIMKSNNSAALINDLRASLAFARSEAVRRGSPVALCRSLNGSSCQDGGVQWQEGWIIFNDLNGNGVVDADEGDEVLKRYTSNAEEFILSFAPRRVAYGSLGLATHGVNGTYILCDERGDHYSKGVIVSVVGWPRLAVDKNTNGVVEDAGGSDLTCPG